MLKLLRLTLLVLLLRPILLVLAAALLIWAMLVTLWSYPHPWLMFLGLVASLGAAAALLGSWQIGRSAWAGVWLISGAAVCVVLLSWSPSAAIVSLLLLVAGVAVWLRNRHALPSARRRGG